MKAQNYGLPELISVPIPVTFSAFSNGKEIAEIKNDFHNYHII